MRNEVLSLNAPAGTETAELNASYWGSPAAAPAEAAAANDTGNDWPSYNRTVSSDRYSPLTEINTTHAGRLKVVCTYDVGEFASFESGLIEVNNALIGTTEYDIFSLNPATCAVNWRAHEDYPGALLPSNRGAAYLDGMLFRGTQDGRVLADDFNTGKRLWETRIANPKAGETVPAAPVVSDGRLFIGNAGGNFKGGKSPVSRTVGRKSPSPRALPAPLCQRNPCMPESWCWRSTRAAATSVAPRGSASAIASACRWLD